MAMNEKEDRPTFLGTAGLGTAGARAMVASVSLIFMFANADFGSLFLASAVARCS